MEHVRIDISQDLDGDDVVHACFDLSPEELAAAAHAVAAYAGERFRTSELSSDDVLEQLSAEATRAALSPGQRAY